MYTRTPWNFFMTTATSETAIEITEGFKLFSPKDPLKYDFVLTRFGIRGDMDMSSLFAGKY
jgi:uncharacterized protein DUF2400